MIAFEFVSLWSAETDNAMLARLCAGSIGVCLDHTSRLPKYRPIKHRASDYGHLCLDRLLGQGVTASVIYEEGIKCLKVNAKHRFSMICDANP